ncbi:MAG: GNAT family N-acetyltransferase [Acidisphaera sp.]|nr:GNAT family N-acetyltransferase [Acidisphaera sp.]
MEPVVRVGVTVTFLRMDRPPEPGSPPLPAGTQAVRLAAPSVAFYRYLYDTVGAPHVWWLRRATPDEELAALLRTPGVSITVLYSGGEPAGFYELDARYWPDVNLSYFGLMPPRVGQGLGYPFLRHAIDVVWQNGARGMTVNTCTADHPRAMPTYLRAGFRPVRQVRETWDVPLRLGLTIPPALRLE